MSQTSQLFSFPPSGLPPPSRSWRVKGQGKDHLGSRGSSTCRANPRRGPVGSKAFWDEITQTQRILEKAPPHSLHKSDPQEGLEARGHHGESLRTPEVDAPISSLVALSFLMGQGRRQVLHKSTTTVTPFGKKCNKCLVHLFIGTKSEAT